MLINFIYFDMAAIWALVGVFKLAKKQTGVLPDYKYRRSVNTARNLVLGLSLAPVCALCEAEVDVVWVLSIVWARRCAVIRSVLWSNWGGVDLSLFEKFDFDSVFSLLTI